VRAVEHARALRSFAGQCRHATTLGTPERTDYSNRPAFAQRPGARVILG